MYKLYLDNEKINNIAAYIPNVARKPIYNQNFANRMLAYLRGISKASQVAANKIEMKSEKGKLIYPKRIKRELGAKVIYDTICPVAANAFYKFEPYEKEYEDMVAEDMGNSIALCEQIADAAIELEKYIKEMSEQELAEEDTIRKILEQCFEEKGELSAMTKANSFNQLVEKIMVMIREVYL